MNKPQKPVVFLDRDGTLTENPDLTWQESRLKLSGGIAEEIAACNAAGIPIIVVTNQSVVARGLTDEDGVRTLHMTLQKRLSLSGAYADAFYFCPHHPEATLAVYRMQCDCRKPATGLFEKAAADFPIEFAKSFMVGDMTQDILAGKNAGTKTILVMAGHGGTDGKYDITPTYTVKTAAEAVRIAREEIIRGN